MNVKDDDYALKQVTKRNVPEKSRLPHLYGDTLTYRQRTRGLSNTRKWEKE